MPINDVKLKFGAYVDTFGGYTFGMYEVEDAVISTVHVFDDTYAWAPIGMQVEITGDIA